MKRVFVITLSVLLLTSLVYAEDGQHSDANTSTKASNTLKKTTESAVSASVIMTNMKKMQDQMTQVYAEKDPKERDRLMQEHMQTMQETMKMMHASRGMGMMDGAKQGGGGKRMTMMQMMMDQMTAHQNAMQDMRKDK